MSEKKKPEAAKKPETKIETPEEKSAFVPNAKTKKVKVNALLCGEWGTFYEGVYEIGSALADQFIKEKLAEEVKD